ncbi:5'-methylthioadenosine/S-adenosylhomocysteine nucleosidase [Paenibacillus sp. M1]|uniref:adenosylhomocysteine nucleosidase n=1 Tax=Paenibacillus haidiansis TaxID=1574488 RepID=A0ABU7VQA3_9BACL
MRRTGLICAMAEEFDCSIELRRNAVVTDCFGWKIHTSTLPNGSQLSSVMSGIGKVNASLAVSILKQKMDVDFILTYGIAGILNKELQIFDQIIGNEVNYHDCWRPNAELDSQYTRLFSMAETFKFDSVQNQRLIEYLQPLLPELPEPIAMRAVRNKPVLRTGKIVTGDIPCNQEETASRLRSVYRADCVDMEGAAVAQACYMLNIPCLTYRFMSDYANEHSNLHIMRNGPYLYPYISKVLPLLINYVTDFGEI